jgi:hypothetical protein
MNTDTTIRMRAKTLREMYKVQGKETRELLELSPRTKEGDREVCPFSKRYVPSPSQQSQYVYLS